MLKFMKNHKISNNWDYNYWPYNWLILIRPLPKLSIFTFQIMSFFSSSIITLQIIIIIKI